MLILQSILLPLKSPKNDQKLGPQRLADFTIFFAMGDSVDKRYIQFENIDLSQLEKANFS